jgi:hypothetical protein
MEAISLPPGTLRWMARFLVRAAGAVGAAAARSWRRAEPEAAGEEQEEILATRGDQAGVAAHRSEFF